MFSSQYVKPNLFAASLGKLKGFNWSGFLDGTQKTLGVINQAIPIVYQVKPIFSNAKTMFRIADEMRSSPPAVVEERKIPAATDSNRPIFYIWKEQSLLFFVFCFIFF